MGNKSVQLKARNRLACQHFDICKRIAFIRTDKEISHPIAPHPARSTTPVNVIFRIFRYVVIKDMADAFHIDTTPDNVRRDQDFNLSLTKSSHHTIPYRLCQITVDQPDSSKFAAQTLAQFFYPTFRAGENNTLARHVLLQQKLEQVELLVVVDRNVILLD